jgi:hypothetical protein
MRQDLLLFSSVLTIGPTIDAFVIPVVPPLHNKYSKYDQYTAITPLDSTTRRQSFGDLLGSTLLPIATAAAITTDTNFIQPVNAADEYPFKVRSMNK